MGPNLCRQTLSYSLTQDNHETGRPLRRIERQRLRRAQTAVVAFADYVDRNLAPLVVGFDSFIRTNLAISRGTRWFSFAVEVPSMLVLVPLGARAPGAHKIFRAIWHRGRELLTMAALGNLAVVIAAVIQDTSWRLSSDWSTLLVAFLHVWALARLWMSPIVEVVFSEFPD